MWRRKRSQQDFRAEVQAHIALEAERLEAEGLSPAEARRQAHLAFGNSSQSEERFYESSRFLLLDHVGQDAHYALRQLAIHRGFSITAMLTLALGIAATTTIFTLIDQTLLRPLPYPDDRRILHITDVRITGRSTAGLVSVPRFFDLEKRAQSFAALGFYTFDHPTLIVPGKLPIAAAGVQTSASFWKAIGIKPLLGRVYTEEEDRHFAPRVALISYAFWQRVFSGDPHIVNKQVMVDGFATTIIGVLAPDSQFPRSAEVWTAARFDPSEWTWRGEGTRFLNVIGRLKPGITPAVGRNELGVLSEQLRKEHPDTDAIWRFGSESLRDFLYGEARPALLVLMAASSVLLLIACINVANLLLSRGTARVQEIAMRRALGASQRRIFAQLVTENLLLTLAGTSLGAATSYIVLRVFAAKIPGHLLTGSAPIHANFLFFACGMALLTGIAFGCVPALAMRRVDLNRALKQSNAQAGRSAGGQLRHVLVAVQVALSMMLLTGASLLGQSLWKLIHAPLGFAPERVLTFEIGLPWNNSQAATQHFYDALRERLQALPGVTAVGTIGALPTVDWHLRSNFDVDWKPATPHKDAVNVEDRSVGGDYFQAMRIPLLAGRYITEADRDVKPPRANVNEAFVRRYIPDGNPVGHRLIGKYSPYEIVGVVANVRGTAGSVSAPPGPELYFLPDARDTNRAFVVRSQVPVDQLARAIRGQVHAIDPTQAVRNIASMDELLEHSVAQPRFNTGLLSSFALLATILACIGIYGVVAYSVAQRSLEIGIRMALGAERRQIAAAVMSPCLVAACMGMIVGIGSALLLTSLLRGQLYGVAPDQPFTYVASALGLLVPVLLASLVPALRAGRANPIEALRVT